MTVRERLSQISERPVVKVDLNAEDARVFAKARREMLSPA
jgi:hypothetical protein